MTRIDLNPSLIHTQQQVKSVQNTQNRRLSRTGRRSGLRMALTGLASVAAPAALRFEGLHTASASSNPVTPAPATAYLPASASVERYTQRWALSCEYAATHTALRILGHDIPEDVMRASLGQGENPDETFRGEIQANQSLENYGVHAKGIARLVNLLHAQNRLPREVAPRLLYDLDSVRAALADGQPVVAWLPLGLRASQRVPTKLASGKTVNLVYAEHTVTLRGYDGMQFYALEPYNGSTPVYELNALWRAMSLFDDPALAIGVAPLPPVAPPPAPLPTSQFFPETGVLLDGGFYTTYRDLGGRNVLGLPLSEELFEPDVKSGAPKQVIYTETARLEWDPRTERFGLGFVGQEMLGEDASPDPLRRPSGAIGRFVSDHGGLARFGYSVSEEVPISSSDLDLLPWPVYDAVGQWFQTGLLIWDRYGREVIWGRAGLALAKHRGYLDGGVDK